MPTLPWTTVRPPDPAATAYVMASRFEVRSWWHGLLFLRHTAGVWRQVRRAPGALGATLVARPLRRTFLTLSAWESRDALYRYARAAPHRGTMAALAPAMRRVTFTHWAVPAGALPVGWPDALARLDAQAAADAGGGAARR
ncbi:hypothetical protein GCM10010123_24100 [Pilimelia anulata]|uniref:DUF3291 domain-containing protein n=1 Tax=Pilimelia anulata TaxID=53371 RepID=A0A8J3B6L9_9ACTN|nr:DUF3291 domain-containing protein [Pilimelia anulata]GGJ93434.1 hypothetical protein GCM10010123_24100 [Pilimelia anulata]